MKWLAVLPAAVIAVGLSAPVAEATHGGGGHGHGGAHPYAPWIAGPGTNPAMENVGPNIIPGQGESWAYSKDYGATGPGNIQIKSWYQLPPWGGPYPSS